MIAYDLNFTMASTASATLASSLLGENVHVCVSALCTLRQVQNGKYVNISSGFTYLKQQVCSEQARDKPLCLNFQTAGFKNIAIFG